ncbi:response regulator transcription factor [Acetanaerobacterium elongatum]|uniref:Stage 0 sporulation protein A homolog n=1 Tax=Acetanaerobacterium elongatum TaxID=258515 RepID=A0A1H0FSQ6_9FIRM|nr:response regulator transcription factor [Acetanaerobacterium elongatum]SDN97581.1 two-component system, OmpR family, phosphate regulon response regulator PhoB [Acetanaerobacterium elongatum]
MKKAVILIVEDDYNIRTAGRLALELEGYSILEAETLAKGRAAAEALKPDLIILDILLPDGNGLQYCEELRGKNDVRILFLSALNTKTDVLAGLRAGGDDYISKPFDMDELLLRVEALLRRGRLIGTEDPPQKLCGLELYPCSSRAILNGQDLLLTPKEFALISILVRNCGSSVTASELYEKVWGMDMIGDAHTVKEHISRIRSKLGMNSDIVIVSERSKGYRLETASTKMVAKS